MTFLDYFSSLSKDEREAYARRAKTTIETIRTHWISRRRIPRPVTMQNLYRASRGKLTYQDLLRHFYPEAYTETKAA